jgi:hypothetical protein
MAGDLEMDELMPVVDRCCCSSSEVVLLPYLSFGRFLEPLSFDSALVVLSIRYLRIPFDC